MPTLDDQVDAWFRLSFGAQQAHGLMEVDARRWPPHTRRAEPGDIEALIKLAPLVYEREGRVVAGFELVPAEKIAMHRGLARPERAVCIGWAASLPDVRGSGGGPALTEAAFAWAHEQGYAAIVTDWRETNLLSSRFWPARGFRRSFLRLYRSIP